MLNSFRVGPKDCPQKGSFVDRLFPAVCIGRCGSLTRSLLVFVPILFHLVAYDGMAQPPTDTTEYAKRTIFASGLGNGGLFSLNLDRRWRLTGDRGMSLSAGLTYFPLANEPVSAHFFSLPCQWNWFKGQVHHREHGTGLTFGSGWYTDGGTRSAPIVSRGIYLFIKPIGYRLQQVDGGLFVRVNILLLSKVVEVNSRYVEESGYWERPPVMPWFGVDMGYTFRCRKKSFSQ